MYFEGEVLKCADKQFSFRNGRSAVTLFQQCDCAQRLEALETTSSLVLNASSGLSLRPSSCSPLSPLAKCAN